MPVRVTFNNQERIENLAGRLAAQLEVDSLSLVQQFLDPEFLEEQRAHRAKLKKARENRVRFMTRKAKERKEARQLKRAKRKEERQKNRDS